MMTLGEAKASILRYIDEYSLNGTNISEQENSDYIKRIMPTFINDALMAVAKIDGLKLVDSYYIVQRPLKPIAGLITGFDAVDIKIEPYIIEGLGARSYHFELEGYGQALVQVQDEFGNWVTQRTIDNTSTGEFIQYKGLINNPSGRMARVYFSSDYVFTVKNTALWVENFPSDELVQTYRPSVRYKMPGNFMNKVQVYRESNEREYVKDISSTWEADDTWVTNYYNEGAYKVVYNRYPRKLVDGDLDTVVLDCKEEAERLVCLKAAANLIRVERMDIAVALDNQYEVELARASGSNSMELTSVDSVYGFLGV